MSTEALRISDLAPAEPLDGSELFEATQHGVSVRVRATDLIASGKSAYQIALELGFVGDESAWLNSMRGPQGQQGQQGTQGIQGVQGPEGQMGAHGLLGPAGQAGPQGLAGEAGPQGIQGPQGPQGATGPTGAQGPQGAGLRIRGAATSVAALPNNAALGDGWLVANTLWIRTEVGWHNSGSIVNSAELEELRRQAAESAQIASEKADIAERAAAGMTHLETIVDYMGSQMADLLKQFALLSYAPPVIASFTVDGQATKVVEQGTSQVNVVLAWVLTGSIPESQFVTGGVGAVPVGQAAKTVVGPFTTNQSWTLTVRHTDPVGVERVVSATTLFAVRQKRYWGMATQTTLSNAQILSFTSEFATSKTRSISYDTTGGRYPYYAFPASMGSITGVLVNGTVFTDYTQIEQLVTNAQGYTELYRIVRFNALPAAGALTVAWS